jgi:hypothetical protein
LRDLRGVSRTVFSKPIRDKNDPTVTWTHVLKLNQPSSIDTIELLQRFYREANHKVAVCRLHVALDFDPRPGVSRKELIELIETAFHLRYRRNADEPFEYLGTRYATKAKGRKSRLTKQTAFYHDRVGRLDGECDKIHFEIRLEKKRAVKAAGVEAPIDLLTLDPRSFVQEHLKIADHKPAMRRIVKKAIDATISHYANPHVDIAKRVQSLFKRMGTDTLTGFKRLFPIRAERLKPLDVMCISNQLHWVPRMMSDQPRDETGVNAGKVKCGELSPLSPAARKRRRIRLRIHEKK